MEWRGLAKLARDCQAFSGGILKPRPIITPATYLESTLVEVFILDNLNFPRINTFEKQGEGCPVIVNQAHLEATVLLRLFGPHLPA